MRTQFADYLKAIDLPEPFYARVETITDFYETYSGEELLDIFITDFIKEDGTREFECLWFFSANACMEAKAFLTKDDFDLAALSTGVVRWQIQKQDYDFTKATSKSRMNLTFNIETSINGVMKASNKNCDYLKEIFLKFIRPKTKTAA